MIVVINKKKIIIIQQLSLNNIYIRLFNKNKKYHHFNFFRDESKITVMILNFQIETSFYDHNFPGSSSLFFYYNRKIFKYYKMKAANNCRIP